MDKRDKKVRVRKRKLVVKSHVRGGRVEGLDSETEIVEYQDGEDIILRKRPGRVKY